MVDRSRDADGAPRAHAFGMAPIEPKYSGPERRYHRVYVTKNTEYHCRHGVCVAVRDVASGAFLSHHAALGRVAGGVVRLQGNGTIGAVAPIDGAAAGMRVHFSYDADDRSGLVTSSIQDVRRPAREIVASYAAR